MKIDLNHRKRFTANLELNLKNALQRTLSGEKVKGKYLQKLGALPEICKPILSLDSHLRIDFSNSSDELLQLMKKLSK